MARRVAARGHYLPQLEAGLRAHAAQFLPQVRLPILDLLDLGEPFPIGGDVVWAGLHRVDSTEADAFRRQCGHRPGATSAWLAVDRTRWIFDPRRCTLQPADPQGVAP